MPASGPRNPSARRPRRAGLGIAAIEFALAVPVLVAATLLAVDLVTLLRGHMRMEHVASEVANLLGRYDALRESDIAVLFSAASAVANPWRIDGTAGALVLTGVVQEATGAQVAWQRRTGTLSCRSQIGTRAPTAPPVAARLPTGLTLAQGQSVVTAEACTNLYRGLLFPEVWQILVGLPDPTDPGRLPQAFALFRPRTAQLASVQP